MAPPICSKSSKTPRWTVTTMVSWTPASASPTSTEDGSVSGPDLAVILSAWGTANASADLDGDGQITGADLSLVLANWGPCSGG